jgi:hypothetical protein
MISPYC